MLKGWVNRFDRQALREIGDAYKEMLEEMVEYAVEHRASQNTPHSAFYEKFEKFRKRLT